jgi:hypothetical protein
MRHILHEFTTGKSDEDRPGHIWRDLVIGLAVFGVLLLLVGY